MSKNSFKVTTKSDVVKSNMLRLLDIIEDIYEGGHDAAELRAEYMEKYAQIRDILELGEDSAPFRIECHRHESVVTVGRVRKANLAAGTILYHCHSAGGRTELRSSYAARDYVKYSEDRIYFTLSDYPLYMDKASHVYEYVCDGSESLYWDYEFDSEESNGCVYIASDEPFTLPVRELSADEVDEVSW